MQLQFSDSTAYSQVREMILAYERSTAKWKEQTVLGSDNHNDTSAPMEVDMIQKGGKYGKKGKSAKSWDKGSGNLKGGQAEKGKSKYDKGQKGQVERKRWEVNRWWKERQALEQLS